MKPKLNKDLSLPWTPQGESEWKPSNSLAKRKSYELNFPPYKLTRSQFLAFFYQFFDLVDCVVVTDKSPQS